MSGNFNPFVHNVVDPQMLVLNTNVAQPNYLYGRRLSGDVGYLASPDTTASVGSFAFSSELDITHTPVESIEDHGNGVAQTHTGSSRPLQPMLQQQQQMAPFGTSLSQDINLHVDSMYTPGYVPSGFANITVTPADESSSSHFLNTDPVRLPCKNFLQPGSANVIIECSLNSYAATALLVTNINDRGYVVHVPKETGEKAALSSLQLALGSEFPRQTPPSHEQLQNLIHSIKSRNPRLAQALSHSTLSYALAQYGWHHNHHLQLGVIDEAQSGNYRATTYADASYAFQGVQPKTIWLFHSPPQLGTAEPSSWAAFVAPNFHPRPEISYARALAPTVLPMPQPLPHRTRLLSPHSPGISRNPSPAIRGGRNARSIRPRTPSHGKQPGVVSGHGRTDSLTKYACKNCSKAFETQSELIHHRRKYTDTTKTHFCEQCNKGFLYPKDLRRHYLTHTGERKHKCHFCTKDFTRKDNLQRHLREDHREMTPPESVEAGA